MLSTAFVGLALSYSLGIAATFGNTRSANCAAQERSLDTPVESTPKDGVADAGHDEVVGGDQAPRPAPQLGDTWAALLAQAGVDSAPGSARLFHVWISLKQRHAAAPASRARADAILAGARRPADALALRVPRTVDFLPSELGPNTFFVDGDFFDTASDAERQQIFKRRVLARAGLVPAPHAAAPPAPPNAALNVAAKVFTPSAEVVAYAYRMSKLGASDARVAAKLHQLRARALACLN